jgi:hypothetical protein
MTTTFLDCPGCCAASEFVQLHPEPERCPDVPSGSCPEWCCVGCGAGLMLELPPVSLEKAARRKVSTGSLDRVA